MDRVFRVDSVDADGLEGIVTLPNDLAGMEKTILEHDIALVILDPLLTFVNAKLDTHKDAETRRALEPVVRMAHDTKAAVIGLIHVNKTSEGDLMNRVMGSRAIGAVARAVLFCGTYKPVEEMAEEDPENPFASPDPGAKRSRFVFGQIKNNLQQKVPKSIEYHIEGTRVGYDEEAKKDIEGSFLVLDGEHQENVEDIILEQEKRTKGTKTGASRAEVWLAAYLTGKGEVSSGQVFRDAEKANFSRNQVYAGKAKLGDRLVVRRVAQMHSGTTWEFIPEDQTSGTSGTSGDEWDESDVLASHSSGLSRKTRRVEPDKWTKSDPGHIGSPPQGEPGSAKALATKVVIDGAARYVAYLRDLAEKPRLVGKRQDMIKTDDPHVIQILCQGCGDPKENDSWKCYMYTDDKEGLSWPLCYDCVRGPSPDPRFIWDGDVPQELLYVEAGVHP
jgi:AAA domain